MRVLIVNGSPHENGCTRGALEEVASMLINDGIETEWFWIGMEPVAGCIACKHCQSTGRCCKQDLVNEFLDKADTADGFLFGSPVYFAGITGQLKCFMDRVFYCGDFPETGCCGCELQKGRSQHCIRSDQQIFSDQKYAGSYFTILEPDSWKWKQKERFAVGSGRTSNHADAGKKYGMAAAIDRIRNDIASGI